jgi:Fe-S-cluster containining protein
MSAKQPYWSCDKRGDCCRQPRFVIMTTQERAEVLANAPKGVTLAFQPLADDRFVALEAGPCPLLSEDGSCTIYAHRPYNCRRFICLRQPDEPWISAPPDGCVNLDRRISGTGSHQAMAFFRSQERRHQPWALAHGWGKEMQS